MIGRLRRRRLRTGWALSRHGPRASWHGERKVGSACRDFALDRGAGAVPIQVPPNAPGVRKRRKTHEPWTGDQE